MTASVTISHTTYEHQNTQPGTIHRDTHEINTFLTILSDYHKISFKILEKTRNLHKFGQSQGQNFDSHLKTSMSPKNCKTQCLFPYELN